MELEAKARPSPFVPMTAVDEEIHSLRAQVSELEAHRHSANQQSREEVEELRNLRVEVAKLRTERTRGGSHSDHSHPMDQSGGSRMAALIDASDAKRRCLERGPQQ